MSILATHASVLEETQSPPVASVALTLFPVGCVLWHEPVLVVFFCA